MVDNRAWFMKHKPTTLDEIIFPNTLNGSQKDPNEIKAMFTNMLNNGIISGNILSFGPGGFGKSSLADVITKNIIKEPKDFYRLGKGVEAVEDLKAWLLAKPGKSSQKVVLIEEANKLSPQAQTALKDGLMEKYQGYVTFIANTNVPQGIDAALKTRFNFQLNFKDIQPEEAFKYLCNVLEKEGIQYNKELVWEFTYKNIGKGLRVLINNLEINVIDKKLETIGEIQSGTNNEDYIIGIVEYLIQLVESLPAEEIEKILANVDANPTFSQYYTGILNTTKNDMNLDYDFIFSQLIEKKFNLDILNTLMENYQEMDFKKFLNLHLVSSLNKVFQCIKIRKSLL